MGKLTTAETRPKSGVMRLAERLVRLPRLTRIIIVVLFAALTTLLITPIVDGIYLRNYFDYNTRILPSLVSAAIGIGMFAVGWVIFVGFAGEELQARKAVLWYFLIGGLVLMLVLLLLITGALDVAQ